VPKEQKRTVYVVQHDPRKRDWRVVIEGSNRVVARDRVKDGAIREAVAAAKARPLGQVRIKGRDGHIQQERTYPRSSDPGRAAG
jgi:Uncharacterized protein conserved in bacteria (DUF2188)